MFTKLPPQLATARIVSDVSHASTFLGAPPMLDASSTRMAIAMMLVMAIASDLVCPRAVANEARDWTEFRGPDGQGHTVATDVPLTWSASENVVWRTEIPGEGWSSPVVKGDRIYLTAAVVDSDTEGRALRLIIVDAPTGRIETSVEAFEQAADAPGIHSKNSHASSTPLIAGDRVYAHFGHQGMASFDLDGKLIWRNNSFPYPPRHGNGGSPAWVDGRLIFSCDGDSDPFVLALSASNGEAIWKSPRASDASKKFSFSTPLLIQVDGRDQLISPGSNCVVAYDPQNGQEIWRVNYNGYSVVPRPVYGHGLVYISTSFDSPQVMAIQPDGQGDVTDTKVAWTAKRGAPNTPSLLLVGDYLYMVSDGGVASCLDAKTGETKWQERLGGGFSASPLYADGRVYFQNEEGEATVVAAEPTFQILARNDLQERTLASYGVIEHDLLIRTDKHLYRIGTPH
jgi:outer membrane protein assembly factor BamB